MKGRYFELIQDIKTVMMAKFFFKLTKENFQAGNVKDNEARVCEVKRSIFKED